MLILLQLPSCYRIERIVLTLKGTKGTISLAQANDAVPGPNYMLKSLWE